MEKTHVAEFLYGLGIGAVTALLFAPRSGKKTRTWIHDATTDGVTRLKDCSEAMGDAVSEFIEQGRDTIARHKQGVTEAIKRGSFAYKRAAG